jgi:geranylgeranyl reductase family protein
MGSPRLVTSPEPLVYMVRRSQFDNLLTSQAIDAGAELQDATTVEHIEIQETGVMVAASSGSCTADFLIGADGALGITARAAGLMANRVLLPAVEHEVEVAPSVADFWQDKMSLDLGTLRASYGWVFPKGDHLNVGVGGFGQHSSFGSNLRRYDAEHLQRRIPDLLRVRKSFGYVLPLRKESSPIQRGRVLLVGDAAGLVEAMTGEGIYYAVRSGQIAAQSIISAQHGGYQARIDREIMPDLLIARSWAALYRWAPLLCYAGPVTSARAWRATGRVLRGDYQIRAIHRRLGLLGKLADRLPTYP